MPLIRFLSNLAEFVKFSHTIFALPFALMAMVLAADGWPRWTLFGWILLCMAGARTAAMCFNRLVDWEIDRDNPRTEGRHRLVSKGAARSLMVVSLVLLVFGAMQLNTLCLALSPLAIALITLYSITKRFTSFSHLFLGLALGAAPMGAWAAVRGELLSLLPYVLALAVLLWVAGFDVIYATMDVEFDRKKGLNSIPVRFGVSGALALSKGMHVAAAMLFGWAGWLGDLGWAYGAAWILSCGALVWEHRLSGSSDPHVLNRAFFEINAVVSILLLLGVLSDKLLF